MDSFRPNDERGKATVLSISGMSCSGCASTVSRVLSKVPGVATAKVDFANGKAVITGDAPPEGLIAAIEAAGYGARPSENAISGDRNERSRNSCC